MTEEPGAPSTYAGTDRRQSPYQPRPPGRRDVIHEESDGNLVLEPAVVVTELERRFLADAVLEAEITYATAHPESVYVVGHVERAERARGPARPDRGRELDSLHETLPQVAGAIEESLDWIEVDPVDPPS